MLKRSFIFVLAAIASFAVLGWVLSSTALPVSGPEIQKTVPTHNPHYTPPANPPTTGSSSAGNTSVSGASNPGDNSDTESHNADDPSGYSLTQQAGVKLTDEANSNPTTNVFSPSVPGNPTVIPPTIAVSGGQSEAPGNNGAAGPSTKDKAAGDDGPSFVTITVIVIGGIFLLVFILKNSK